MHQLHKRLAMIGFDDIDLIALDAVSGRWIGGSQAEAANAIAVIADATPDKGNPTAWVAQTVNAKLGGKLQIFDTGREYPAGTVH